MKALLPLVLACFFAGPVSAQGLGLSEDAPVFLSVDEVDFKELVWKYRPVVVFADTPNDPAFIEQIELLHARERELRIRDVLVITDTDPDARSELRLKLRPRGFMLALIGKDGAIKIRKPFPWDVREITRSIDKMPIRKREIREEKEQRGDG
jgi:hypothetical protein